jgi:murein DD-endopeptidase MepM/ murein hydrolase activator NlpD
MNPRIPEPFLTAVLTALLFVIFPQRAFAFQAEISPKTISPGDVFLIKVTDAKPSLIPSASLAKNVFFFADSGNGCFITIGAVDIKTKPGTYIIKIKSGQKQKKLKVSVKKTRFPKLELTLPADKVFLSPDDLDLVKNENKRLRAIFQTVSERRWRGAFIMPLENDNSTVYGTKRIMNKKFVSVHKGLDIKGKEGEEIKASNDGRVVLAEGLFFGGNTLILDHGQGLYTIYMHLSGFKAKPDEIVSKGEVVGFVGSSGRSSGYHLHFGVKVMDINVNPVSLIKLGL